MRFRTESKVVILDKLAECACEARKLFQGALVFTNGAYDLFHDGHVEYLEDAAACGSCLFVGVNSDVRVKHQKGEKRPIVSENVRVRVVAALAAVDFAFIYTDLEEIIELIKPDIIIASPTTCFDPFMERYQKAREMGIEIKVIDSKSNLHTSDIIRRIRILG